MIISSMEQYGEITGDEPEQIISYCNDCPLKGGETAATARIKSLKLNHIKQLYTV